MIKVGNGINKKKLISWLTGGLSALGVLALTFGLVFGLGNFSSKSQIVQPGQLTQGATEPTNDKYWNEAHDSGNITLDFDWEGSGSEDSPYLISSAEELAGLSYTIYKNTVSYDTVNGAYGTVSYYYYSKCYFRQTCDIDVSDYWWQPIGVGSSYRYFHGNYDGDGHTVSGVFTKSGDYKGLFSYVKGGGPSYPYQTEITIKNLGVIDSVIEGSNRVGGLVGRVDSYVNIKNCYSTANVSATASSAYVGGIAGDSAGNYIKISNCYNTGTIQGYYAGGLVGYARGTTITNCFNVGKCSGSKSGGLIGYKYVRGDSITQYELDVHTNNCYYGGECSSFSGHGEPTYSNMSASGTKIVDLNSTEYAKNKNWYLDDSNWSVKDETYKWDFENVWTIINSQNNGYPIFLNNNAALSKVTIDVNGGDYDGLLEVLDKKGTELVLSVPTKQYHIFDYWEVTGDGSISGNTFIFGEEESIVKAIWKATHWIALTDTSWHVEGVGDSESNPYIIDSAEKLAGLAQLVNDGVDNFENKFILQACDIDLSKYKWIAIGKGFDQAFNGKYDGGNYSISGINLDDSQGDYQGLFGYVGNDFNCNATIKNVIVKNSYMTTSKQYLGGIVGLAQYSGNIINCRSEVTLENTHASGYAGGIFTTSGSTVTITGCVFIGNVTATGSSSCAGGIAAAHMMGTMSNCHVSNSNIKGSKAGGLSGDGYQPKINNSIVTNC